MEIEEFQNQIDLWMKFNFGSIDTNQHGPAHWPLLAIVEETSEIIESFESGSFKKNARDAIADSMIACIGYCAVNNWNAQELWLDRINLKLHFDYIPLYRSPDAPEYLVDNIIKLNIIIGKLCRSHLKKEEGIRDSFEKQESNSIQSIQELMLWLEHMYKSLRLEPPSFMENLTNIWLKVRKRDFVHDPTCGTNTKLDWK